MAGLFHYILPSILGQSMSRTDICTHIHPKNSGVLQIKYISLRTFLYQILQNAQYLWHYVVLETPHWMIYPFEATCYYLYIIYTIQYFLCSLNSQLSNTYITWINARCIVYAQLANEHTYRLSDILLSIQEKLKFGVLLVKGKSSTHWLLNVMPSKTHYYYTKYCFTYIRANSSSQQYVK